MQPSSLSRKAQKASLFLKFLAHPVRLRILCLLATGEHHTVSELQKALHISQPLLSQHLALLRRHKLVGTTRNGQHIIYAIQNPLVEPILSQLHSHFCSPKG